MSISPANGVTILAGDLGKCCGEGSAYGRGEPAAIVQNVFTSVCSGFRSDNERVPTIDAAGYPRQGEAMRALHPTNGVLVLTQVLLAVVFVSVLPSGCGGAPGGNAQPVDAAEIVDSYDCLAPNLGGWAVHPDPTHPPGPQHLDAPDPGRVPTGFIPTTAVRCDQMASVEDAEGQWSAVTAVTLTGDLTPLLAALGELDDGIGPGPCTADIELVPPLWLVDAAGRAIHAHYPRDRCAKTKPGVHTALAGLSVRDTTTLKQTLIVPRAALDSGCAAAWTAPFNAGIPLSIPSAGSSSGAVGASPAPPTPIADTVLAEMDGLRWCRYAVEPAPADLAEPGGSEPDGSVAAPAKGTLHSGRFVAGGTLDTATARLVADVAASGPVSRSCDESATKFLTLRPSRGGHELGSIITVELDGCGLLHRDGSDARTLPADARELLTVRTSR
ncbi:hypothetical protein E2F48_14190 [Arthrobacter crusticola]|uniref:Uncharacterized protein n=1 Tax=Arthrobacter crusticola TaxID=2547960 RepID=A0A4R5TMU2_9MICC|nr:hypothetical protein [Arthrobacter crusticola]TDK23941.1 hypothetical protein E2F48_14190 [Arthrobacter crusticola]